MIVVKSVNLTMSLLVSRLFDEQRTHFAMLASQQAESYFANQRDVTKATMEMNILQLAQKKDREAKLREDEVAQDRLELQIATQTREQYVASNDMMKY